MIFISFAALGIFGYLCILCSPLLGRDWYSLFGCGALMLIVFWLRYRTLDPFAPFIRKDQGTAQRPAAPPRPAQPIQRPPVQPPVQPPATQPVAAQPAVAQPVAAQPAAAQPAAAAPAFVDIDSLCPGCMLPAPPQAAVCPHCGWQRAQANPPHTLAVGSLLAGKYLVGRMLGQGGFGITYIGWDIPRACRVAIKEYYPTDGVTRGEDSYTVSPHTQEGAAEVYAQGRSKFFDEAQRLSRFHDVRGIVDVEDFFLENNTAYIVMEYIAGRTMRAYLAQLGSPMHMADVLILLEPVVQALQQVHAAGIIHRDISPDNIMLTPAGEAKLLDFGAARAFSLQGERSNTVNVKAGYAPLEQFNTHGEQGPWTDVYALSATIYRAITGQVPAESLGRFPTDTLRPPSALGADITPAQERALLKGMALYVSDRYKTVQALYDALTH